MRINAMNPLGFGPDGKQLIDLSKTAELLVPGNKKVFFSFSCIADWENCLMIYDSNWKPLFAKGNGPRNLTAESIPASRTRETYYIAAWHKPHKPEYGHLYNWEGSRIGYRKDLPSKKPSLELISEVGFTDAGMRPDNISCVIRLT